MSSNDDRLSALEAQLKQLTASVEKLVAAVGSSQLSPAPAPAPAGNAVGNSAPLADSDGSSGGGHAARVTPQRSFHARLCSGDLGCALNALFCPAVMVFHALDVYLSPCIGLYVLLALETAILGCLRVACCGRCTEYRDKKFPPAASSIGAWRGSKDPTQINEQIKWRRARELFEERLTDEDKKAGVRVKLFEDGISPRDLAQGQVGDCWLIAALACAAENPGLIARTFMTKRLSPRGKYTVRLFNMSRSTWELVTVDDYIPVSDGSPLFAQPHGRELWVAILEKSFAKFLGSYDRLDGGFTLWAFSVLTGDPVYRLQKGAGEAATEWHRLDLSVAVDAEGKRSFSFRRSTSPSDKRSNEDAFFLVRKYCKARALLGASFGAYEKGGDKGGGDEEKGLNGEDFGPQGLVAGHAYSVLDACSFSSPHGGKARINLIQLRNPWGRSEWTGAWSDSAPEWGAHPRIRRMIRPEVADDGKFWMRWEDFSEIFSTIDVCSRSTGVLDLHLDVMESDGCVGSLIGPVKGCVSGCAKYWCACRGCTALYCNDAGSAEMGAVELHEKDDTVGEIFTQTMARAGLGAGVQII